MAWLIERWGAPAVLGNQAVDYGLLHRMTVAHNVYQAVRAVREARDLVVLQQRQPLAWDLFAWLVEEGYTR